MIRKSLIPVLAIALTLATGLVLNAQSRSNAPAIGGYCPVAYVAMKRAVRGNAQISSVHEGKTYLFSNADAKMMFDKEPGKYVPAYDGWCATAVAQGMKLESRPTLFSIHNDRAYLFSNNQAKQMFDKDAAGIVAKANAEWPRVAKMQ